MILYHTKREKKEKTNKNSLPLMHGPVSQSKLDNGGN